ncbi:MAG: hypothetical protein ACI4JS_04065 [Oscillospiraceae bacterium]
MPDNQFDEVLLILLQQEEKKLRADFAELGAFTPKIPGRTDDKDFEERIYTAYKRGGDSQRLTYAASLGMRISLNLCIAKNLKDAIDAYHTADPNNDLSNSTRNKLKKYVDEKIAVECRTDGEKNLFKNISDQLNNHIRTGGTTKDFLAESYIAFENMYSLKNNKQTLADELEAVKNGTNSNINHSALYRANMKYLEDLKDTAIAPIRYEKTYYVLPDVGIDDVRYGKTEEELDVKDLEEVVVDPKSFIESYKKQKAYEARDNFPDIKKMVKKDFEYYRELNLNSKKRELKNLRKDDSLSDEDKETKIQKLEQEIKEIAKEKFSDWKDDQIKDHFKKYSYYLKEEDLPGYHKLSASEMEYRDSIYDSIVGAFNDNISEFSGDERETTEWEIKVDGKACDSKEELVVAALSGKKITGEYAFQGEPARTVNIQPEFFIPKYEESYEFDEFDNGGKWANPNASIFDKFLDFFESVWESIKDALGFSEKAQKEKREKALEEKVEKGNKKLWKNQTREKTSYEEIAYDSFSEKLISDDKRIGLEGFLENSKYKPAPNAAAAAPNAAAAAPNAVAAAPNAAAAAPNTAAIQQDNVDKQNDAVKKDTVIEKITIADISDGVKKTTSDKKSGTVEKDSTVQKSTPVKNK